MVGVWMGGMGMALSGYTSKMFVEMI